MKTYKATAIAHPNIAFIKYWGNQNNDLRIPSNGSISMNMEGLSTTTSVEFSEGNKVDSLQLNAQPADEEALQRISAFLDHFRELSGVSLKAKVISENNFPMGAGIASSSSAFAALATAVDAALNVGLSEAALSSAARLGSGSASRSIPSGFVEWQAGSSHESSHAFTIADPGHWDLVDLVAVVNAGHKSTGSGKGQQLAHTSPLQSSRVQSSLERLYLTRDAILEKDFQKLADVVEEDCNIMHAVMMTSKPPLIYWDAATIEIIKLVREWRDSGLPVFYTIDAGPNVHVITLAENSDRIQKKLEEIASVQNVLKAVPGKGAVVLETYRKPS